MGFSKHGTTVKSGCSENVPSLIYGRVDSSTTEYPSLTARDSFKNHHWLVVEPYSSEKYKFVSWDDDIPNMMGKS